MPRRRKQQAEPAEFPDDATINGGANYDMFDPLEIADKDPEMRYYFAAADDDGIRPDGVRRMTQQGYRKSEKKHASQDCVLMEIPRDEWERREAEKAKANAKKLQDSMRPSDGLEIVKGQRHGFGR